MSSLDVLVSTPVKSRKFCVHPSCRPKLLSAFECRDPSSFLIAPKISLYDPLSLLYTRYGTFAFQSFFENQLVPGKTCARTWRQFIADMIRTSDFGTFLLFRSLGSPHFICYMENFGGEVSHRHTPDDMLLLTTCCFVGFVISVCLSPSLSSLKIFSRERTTSSDFFY